MQNAILIDELKEFFASTEIPCGLEISKGMFIYNPSVFISAHLMIIENKPKTKEAEIALNRLILTKKLLE